MADPTVGQRKYQNYMQVIRAIWNENGIKGFFKGLTASYIGCFEGAIHWVVYEKCKTRLKQNRIESDQPKALELFFAAGFSKFVAICATYPHEVVRTRLREQATNGVFKYNGFVNTLGIIAKEEGMRYVISRKL